MVIQWRKYMENKFIVINGDKKSETLKKFSRAAKLTEIWQRLFIITDIEKADLSQSELIKIGFAGVKYICNYRDTKREYDNLLQTKYKESLDESKALFQTINYIFDILGRLTVINFVRTFPIIKEYDGDKWECKDYFYTMDILSKMDWDKPIGSEGILAIFWDYQNKDLIEMYLEYMDAASSIYRSQTGKDIAEQWCEDNGIPTYTINSDSGVIRDNQTGEITKMRKRSHIQIVK